MNVAAAAKTLFNYPSSPSSSSKSASISLFSSYSSTSFSSSLCRPATFFLRNLNLISHSSPPHLTSSLVIEQKSSTTESNTTSTTSTSTVEEVDKQEKEETSSSSKSVSRRLILLRHAQSSWKDRSLRDHNRPLSDDGRVDAITVSNKLQQLGWLPQLILSSDATRTRETLKIMQEQVKSFLEAEVHFISSFYSIAAMDGQTADHLQQAICQYSKDEIFTVMCMGHNRGWEEAASMLSGTAIELKTCNAALLEAPGKSWEEAFALAGLGGWNLHGIVKPS
ncbi:uncharacterized protein At3g52155, chloroplastic [Papaver somniferum]|uniref:uncharacterized protein At3g52155, chloroplastic n=1 Tax=Papaver somniferum TaxID=3469 RepID=UPI000E700657|nr:uncharacterized protein At3g52155, chloroplastic [Papaver somniferum]